MGSNSTFETDFTNEGLSVIHIYTVLVTPPQALGTPHPLLSFLLLGIYTRAVNAFRILVVLATFFITGKFRLLFLLTSVSRFLFLFSTLRVCSIFPQLVFKG
jgi:hypothetical protein